MYDDCDRDHIHVVAPAGLQALTSFLIHRDSQEFQRATTTCRRRSTRPRSSRSRWRKPTRARARQAATDQDADDGDSAAAILTGLATMLIVLVLMARMTLVVDRLAGWS
jgi:hypothetical protein